MVMEVSSHALAMGRVGAVRFDVVGWTNFGSDHLDFHADSADYFAAKARLFDGRAAVEILNYDDAALDVLHKPQTVTYSAAGHVDATWFAGDIKDEGFVQRFTAHGPAGHVPAGVRQPGRHNVANALLAIAALTCAGVRPEVAAAGVFACPGVPGRLERVPVDGPVIGVVDYAHKTDAISRSSAVAGSSACSARAATATRASARTWAPPRCGAPTCSSSPTTTRAPRIRPRSARGFWPVRARSRTAVRPR
jgi:UDP-N-acetylmuramoyl-L-alanyl-D-glutamate--2,6-diaminopimelate ligase